MKIKQLHTKQEIAHFLDDIIKGCKSIAKKNNNSSAEHLLNMINWNIETSNCFFLIGEHRDRCVGFLFALGIITDKSWCEVIASWSVPRLGSKMKYEGIDLLKKWCKDHAIPTIITNITRNLKSHKKASDGVYMKWLQDLGFEEIGKVVRLTI